MTNPLAGNPLRTPADTAAAVRALVDPLLPLFSAGRGRLRVGPGGAAFAEAAADLEGFARPLWGLAPLAAGGHDFAHWDLLQAGLAAGADPAHEDHWGAATAGDQRIVESAALGFALALAPEIFWDPLTGRGRDVLARWLVTALEAEPHPNNWMFFRVMVSLGLRRVGVAFDAALVEHSLVRMEACDIGQGWYRDGPERRAEHYIPFAMHYYALIYAALGEGDTARRERFKERAAIFAPQLRHWFADDGAALPYGRSLTYRFAHAGFWAALALADVDVLPWGEVRGLWARNLRWWAGRPIADRDGVLSVGYAYPNLLMSERYNSQGSPYWAMKAFLPLALGADHPFWRAEELPKTVASGPVTLRQPGMVLWSEPGNVTALTGGQEAQPMRHGPEKYAKFAYSTRYGFSVESHSRTFETGPFDSMIAFSDDGRRFAVRETELDARIGEGFLYSRWSPMPGAEVETWLLAHAPWHLRVHRIRSDRPLKTVEGGFAARRDDTQPLSIEPGMGRALIETVEDLSLIQAMENPSSRQGRIQQADPNTSLLYPRTWVPQLRGEIAAGSTLLVSAVAGSPDRATLRAALANLPSPPTGAELDRLRDRAEPVPVWDLLAWKKLTNRETSA